MAKRLVTICWKAGVINDDLDVYTYGCELVISSFLGILLSLLSGLFLSNFFETTVFLILFIILRRYTGGFHANSHFNCILGTSLLSIILNMLINICIPIKTSLIIASINGIIIMFLCPVNNQFVHSIHPKSYYKTQSAKLIMLCLLVASISLAHFPHLTLTLSYVISTVSLLMILEVIKMKKLQTTILSSFCALTLLAAVSSLSAVSWSTLYQPIPPVSLKKYTRSKSSIN